MKGSVHAVIGASTPLGLVVAQNVSIPQGLVMAAVASGFSLLPDLDHPNACASKAFGSFVHKAIHRLCKATVKATATGRDRSYVSWKASVSQDPYHRTLTHTIVASLGIAILAYAVSWAGPIGLGFTAAIGVMTLWPLYRKSIGAVVLGAALGSVAAAFLLTPWLMALAVLAGYSSHVIADGCTKGGVPALWPLEIKGHRWRRIRLMGRSISSGSEQEKGPAVGVAAVSNALLLLLML